MSITSFYFLCLFALALLLYYLVPKKVQWPLLLLLSIGYFLTSAEVRDSHAWYLILYPMAAVGAVWGAAILIDRTKEQKKKLAALICAVLFCVGLLCTLKFFHLGLLAPMGISFYTLTLLGYLFDVYYEIGPVQRNYGKLLLFCCYFPTMISGPIMKYSDMEKQMYTGHKLDYRNVTFGMQRMLLGFFKKLVISERTAILANEIFNNYEKYSGVSIWVGAAAFTMQLYTDFDGCMDIVLGISECFGIRLPENFRYPYCADSITDFWRRWHISLSTWFRDYLYIPLGGNRKGILRTMANKLLVFLATGLWHGTGWTFVLWGLWHGLLSCMETALQLPGKLKNRWYGHVYALFAVILGFAVFRAADVSQAGALLGAMLTGFSPDVVCRAALLAVLSRRTVLLCALSLALCLPLWPWLQKKIEPLRIWNALRGCLILLLFALCLLALASGSFQPFIYANF